MGREAGLGWSHLLRGIGVVRRMALQVYVFLECMDKAPAEFHGFIEYPVLVQVFLEIVYWVLLKFAIAPGLSEVRGEMAMAAPPRRFFPCSPHQTLPLLVHELPATTVGECRRRHSLRRHKRGLWTVRLTSFHRVLLQGGFLYSVSPGPCG